MPGTDSRPGRTAEEAAKVVLSRVTQTETGCLIWQGAKTPKGYGQIHVQRRRQAVHRLVWEVQVGPIPEGMEIDHLCRQRLCVNVKHLEPVTHAENVRRQLATRTHCPVGHELTSENVLTYKSTKGYRARYCRTCHNARRRAAASRRREARREAALSCGCPPEHHDEAIRRAADPAERRALLARLTQQSLELGTYDKTAPKES